MDARAFWVDHHGTIRPHAGNRQALNYLKPDHAALRAYVMWRDQYACQSCGSRAEHVPDGYDGAKALRTESGQYLVVDHVLSRRAGGSNRPTNLQCLCLPCNSAKTARDFQDYKASEQAVACG